MFIRIQSGEVVNMDYCERFSVFLNKLGTYELNLKMVSTMNYAVTAYIHDDMDRVERMREYVCKHLYTGTHYIDLRNEIGRMEENETLD